MSTSRTTIVDTSQKVLPQDGYLAYNQAYWNTAVRVTKNQMLQDPDLSQPVAKPYERVPQATVNGYIADWRGFEAAAALEGTRFEHPTLEKGNRYIADVRAAYPILAPGWFVVPRARVSSTAYDLDPAFHPSDSSQTRTLPILSLDTGLIFERDVGWFGRAAQQTLEPRLFYAYIPFRNQEQPAEFRQRARGSQLLAAVYRKYLLGFGSNFGSQSADRRADDAHSGR